MCGYRGCKIWIYVKLMSKKYFLTWKIQLHTYLHQITLTSARADLHSPYRSVSSMSLVYHMTISLTQKFHITYISCFITISILFKIHPKHLIARTSIIYHNQYSRPTLPHSIYIAIQQTLIIGSTGTWDHTTTLSPPLTFIISPKFTSNFFYLFSISKANAAFLQFDGILVALPTFFPLPTQTHLIQLQLPAHIKPNQNMPPHSGKPY